MKPQQSARSRSTPLVAFGLVLAGTLAGAALPRILKAGRKAGASVGGTTYRSHTPDPSVRPTADPARGNPA
jgi:hypothetical protein